MANTYAFNKLTTDTKGNWTDNVDVAIKHLREALSVINKGRTIEGGGRLELYLDYSMAAAVETLPSMLKRCQGLIELSAENIRYLLSTDREYCLRLGKSVTTGCTGIDVSVNASDDVELHFSADPSLLQYMNVGDYVDFSTPRPTVNRDGVISEIWQFPRQILFMNNSLIVVEYDGAEFPSFTTNNYIYRSA